MPRIGTITTGSLSGTHQVADGFLILGGHANRGQFTSSMESGQLAGVAPVGLAPVTGLLRDQ
jgi:hypothetical protein